MEWSEVKSKQFKLMAATAGVGAVLAMSALTVTFSNVSVAEPEPAPPGPVTTSEVTTGETVTETVAPGSAGVPGSCAADHHDTVGLPSDGGTALVRTSSTDWRCQQ